jgi:hypothetical protein
MKSMVELMVVHVATMYVVVVGQVWWFGVLSLMSLFATVPAKSSDELKRWRYSVHQWMLLQPNLPHQPTAARIRIASKQV